MNEVWDFAGKVYDFVENTDWVYAAAPFGEFPFLLHPILTHNISGVIDTLPNGVNPDNALIDPSTNYPTSLGYYYFG